MNERRNFWIEALKGGTIIGLVSVAMSILIYALGEGTLAEVVNFASTVVTILLTFAYARKFAAQHSRSEGFSYGRGVGFVVAMMIFVGVLTGLYTAVMANFFMREELMLTIDQTMASMQDMIPAESFESTYSMMRASVTNPLMLVASSVLSNCFLGLLLGVCVSALTRRQPDIFADDSNNQQ